MHHISVFHDIFLAFEADKSFFLGCRRAAAGYQIIKRDDFRADKAALNIAVNLAA